MSLRETINLISHFPEAALPVAVGNVLPCLLPAALKGLFSPRLVYLHTYAVTEYKKKDCEMPRAVRFYVCNHHTGTVVASWLPEQGVGRFSAGTWPACADCHRKEREELTVLVGQE